MDKPYPGNVEFYKFYPRALTIEEIQLAYDFWTAATAAERARILALVDKMVIDRFGSLWNDDAWRWTEETVHALRATIESGEQPADSGTEVK